ncbi:MAG: hypothetical protein NXI24_18580 [bacterium]|nr:hypothetical protein [bacterium]
MGSSSIIRHIVASFAVLGIAVAAGLYFFPLNGALPPGPRCLFHLAGFLSTFPLHWLWTRLRDADPDSAVLVALGGPTLRFFGFFLMTGIVFAIDRELIWPAAVLYVLTVGTFLCFQVVTVARRNYPGLGP